MSGLIEALHADFNSPVEKGQLLAELDPTPFLAAAEQRRADLRQAQVQLRNSQIAFARQQRLRDQQISALADYDTAQANLDSAAAQVDQAEAALSQAETNLANTKIHSPIDGVVVDRQVDVGQTVAASFQAPTLFTIAQDLTKMQVQADVDQSDIGRVKVGQTARFTVDAFPEQEFSGAITQVRLNATTNQNVITYPVIIGVANPDGKLRPKMTADITIAVATVRDVLRVPNAALRFRPTEGEATAERAGVRSAERGGARGASPGGDRAGEGSSAGAGTRSGERFAGRAGETPAAVPGPSAELPAGASPDRGGFVGAAQQLGGEGRRGRKAMQTVYVLRGNAKGSRPQLVPVEVRTGVSDGRFTAIVEGDLREGDRVVTGLTTTKVEAGARPFGGGRGF